jgi:hypothetical protein
VDSVDRSAPRRGRRNSTPPGQSPSHARTIAAHERGSCPCPPGPEHSDEARAVVDARREIAQLGRPSDERRRVPRAGCGERARSGATSRRCARRGTPSPRRPGLECRCSCAHARPRKARAAGRMPFQPVVYRANAATARLRERVGERASRTFVLTSVWPPSARLITRAATVPSRALSTSSGFAPRATSLAARSHAGSRGRHGSRRAR